MGRRFEKKVYDGGVLTKHLRFVYDGCKLIAIHDALDGDRQVMTFVWQPEGAGLDFPLAMTWNEAAYFYICDGNKNVIAMTDSSGTRVAEYIYAPFGRILHLEGELAEINPFRFSSEYHDDETSLVYYNYRYYNPTLGRWTKRDPIGEKGGVNEYDIIYNKVMNEFDHLGLSAWDWYKSMIIEPEVLRRVLALRNFFNDVEGFWIFTRWALGSGDWFNAPFGDYLKQNKSLNIQLREFMAKEFNKLKHVPTGYVYELIGSTAFELGSGYTTGYQLLNGTNKQVGGFMYKGSIIKRGDCCFDGDFVYVWNDIIDANFSYPSDILASVLMRPYLGFYPRDYTISINFDGKFKAKLNSYGYYDFEGYPHGNPLIDMV